MEAVMLSDVLEWASGKPGDAIVWEEGDGKRCVVENYILETTGEMAGVGFVSVTGSEQFNRTENKLADLIEKWCDATGLTAGQVVSDIQKENV